MAARKTDPPPIIRFSQRTRKAENGCLEWQGPPQKETGYGQFTLANKTMSTHRASWILFRGQIPKNLYVLHKCDNRICVNPNHLFLGTQKDNMDDMQAKGRKFSQRGIPRPNMRGEKHFASLLTDKQVREIAKRLKRGKRGLSRELARQYGVKISYIQDIMRGRKWTGL